MYCADLDIGWGVKGFCPVTTVNDSTPLNDIDSIKRCYCSAKRYKFLHEQLTSPTVNEKSPLNDRIESLTSQMHSSPYV